MLYNSDIVKKGNETMLTRKYHRIIAKAIKTSNSKDEIVNKLCDEFKADNCNFDRYTFKEACGVQYIL